MTEQDKQAGGAAGGEKTAVQEKLTKIPAPNGQVMEVSPERLVELAKLGVGVDARMAELQEREARIRADEDLHEYAKRVARFEHGSPAHAQALRVLVEKSMRGEDVSPVLNALQRGVAPDEGGGDPDDDDPGDGGRKTVPTSAGGGADPALVQRLQQLEQRLQERDQVESARQLDARIRAEVASRPELTGSEAERQLAINNVMAIMATDPTNKMGPAEAADLYATQVRQAEVERRQRMMNERGRSILETPVSMGGATPEVHEPSIEVPKETTSYRSFRRGDMKKAIRDFMAKASIANTNDRFGVPERRR